MPTGSALGGSGAWPQLVAGTLVAWWSGPFFGWASALLEEQVPMSFYRWIADPLASCAALSPFVAGVLLGYAALCLALGRARGRYAAAGGLLASGASAALVVWRLLDFEAAPGVAAEGVLLALGAGLAALALVERSADSGARRGVHVAIFVACVLPGGWQLSTGLAPAIAGSASIVALILGFFAMTAVVAAAVMHRRSVARVRARAALLPAVDAFVAWARARLPVLALPFLMIVAAALLDERHLAEPPLLLAGVWWSMILAIPMTASLSWSLRQAESDGAPVAIGAAIFLLLLRGASDVLFYVWGAESIARGRLHRDALDEAPYVLAAQAMIVLLAEAAVVWHARKRLSARTDDAPSGTPKLLVGWSMRLMSLGALLLIGRVVEGGRVGSALTLLLLVVVLAGADLWFLQQIVSVSDRTNEPPEAPASA